MGGSATRTPGFTAIPASFSVRNDAISTWTV
jgi:hypothetical protein